MKSEKSIPQTVFRRLPENLIYLFLWMIFLAFPFITNSYNNRPGMTGILYDWLRITPFAIVFIVNNMWLLPSFLFRKKQLVYLILILATVFTVSLSFSMLSPVLYRNDPRITQQRILQDPAYGREEMSPDKIPGAAPNQPVSPEVFKKPGEVTGLNERSVKQEEKAMIVLINTILISLLVAGFNTAIAVTNKWFEDEQHRHGIEQEHIRSELAFLQSQVSPHFFMNTLNNIHSLIEEDQNLAQNAILKLSEMMRYLLYESGRGMTTLKKEIDFLHSYIELMQLRVDKSVDLRIELPVSYENVNIPPLLFISFIENAFKHGVSYREPSSLLFRLIQHKDSIEFISENTVPGFRDQAVRSGHGGIGLANIRKRLDMLYGDRHRLEISEKDNKFSVRLIVPV